MNELMQILLKLQAAKFDESTEELSETAQAEMRAKVPPQILGHYDRLLARGKKGVAVVRNQVCTGCHMRIPIGVINTLMQGQDIQLCDNCGRYLHLAPEQTQAPAVAAEGPATPKKATRTRKKKVVEHAAV
jgi:predicted  nucleic acid-binding Zn-ribbon protein